MKLVDLLFDRRCGICNCHIKDGAVCSSCDAEIASHINVRCRKIYAGFKAVEVRYLFDYDVPVVKKLLFKLKRSSNRDLFRYASKLYQMAVPEDFCGVAVNCPRRRVGVRHYGYDQVEVPCKIMCKDNSERMKFEKLLKRRGFSKEQKLLTKEQRTENIKNKFKVTKKDIPENILIVDDVITTGSTVGECAQVLMQSKNKVNVTVICLASRNAFSGKG